MRSRFILITTLNVAIVDLANMHLVEISLRNNVLVQCFLRLFLLTALVLISEPFIASILIKDYGPFSTGLILLDRSDLS